MLGSGWLASTSRTLKTSGVIIDFDFTFNITIQIQVVQTNAGAKVISIIHDETAPDKHAGYGQFDTGPDKSPFAKSDAVPFDILCEHSFTCSIIAEILSPTGTTFFFLLNFQRKLSH